MCLSLDRRIPMYLPGPPLKPLLDLLYSTVRLMVMVMEQPVRHHLQHRQRPRRLQLVRRQTCLRGQQPRSRPQVWQWPQCLNLIPIYPFCVNGRGAWNLSRHQKKLRNMLLQLIVLLVVMIYLVYGKDAMQWRGKDSPWWLIYKTGTVIHRYIPHLKDLITCNLDICAKGHGSLFEICNYLLKNDSLIKKSPNNPNLFSFNMQLNSLVLFSIHSEV